MTLIFLVPLRVEAPKGGEAFDLLRSKIWKIFENFVHLG